MSLDERSELRNILEGDMSFLRHALGWTET